VLKYVNGTFVPLLRLPGDAHYRSAMQQAVTDYERNASSEEQDSPPSEVEKSHWFSGHGFFMIFAQIRSLLRQLSAPGDDTTPKPLYTDSVASSPFLPMMKFFKHQTEAHLTHQIAMLGVASPLFLTSRRHFLTVLSSKLCIG
jgi:hypothetical protein